MSNTIATRPSKVIAAEILAAYETDAHLWRLYHADKWLGERIARLEIELRAQFLRFTPPLAPNCPEAVISGFAPSDDNGLARLETLRRVIQADPDFSNAQGEFGPRYAELQAAKVAEAAQLAELQRQADELAAKREFAEAEAAAQVAKARQPADQLAADAEALHEQIRRITNPRPEDDEVPTAPPAPLVRGKVRIASDPLEGDLH